MKEYCIFHYLIEDQDYLDAYPLDGQSHETVVEWLGIPESPVINHHFCIAKSRNQARRLAYKLWIDESGKGFYQLPYRAYAVDKEQFKS